MFFFVLFFLTLASWIASSSEDVQGEQQSCDGQRYLVPESLSTSILTPSQITQWREKGYLLLNDVFEPSLVEKAVEEVASVYPADKTKSKQWDDFGSAGGIMEFPSPFPNLNNVTLHHTLIDIVMALLNLNESYDLRLTQSDVWAKYGPINIAKDGSTTSEEEGSIDPYSNRNQRIHIDFPNHNLAYTNDWDNPCEVSIIVYYSDSSLTHGHTAVVPKETPGTPLYGDFVYQHTPGFGVKPWFNDLEYVESVMRRDYPQSFEFRRKLYAAEVYTSFTPGTVLFYRHDLWHRGTIVLPNQVRYAHNMVFRKRECDWITSWNYGWARKMYEPDLLLEKLVGGATVKQRNVLGFPPPGHSYWTNHTLRGVQMRYDAFGFDITPYKAQMTS